MNKNGWGLRFELFFILIFVICILISTIGLHSIGLLGGDEDNLVNSGVDSDFDYDALEERVADAGKQYYLDNYPNGSDNTIIVSVDTLINSGYLKSVLDERDKKCTGYVKLLRNGNQVAYLDCSRYQTVGYDKDYE